MDKRRKILEAQERLEKTLSCPDLSSGKSIESLVADQLLRMQFSGTEGEFRHLVRKHSVEVFNFLEMLRSASSEDNTASKAHGLAKNEWKLKQQNDQLRVMYREGPEGTPFHSMLCEGFVDGPIDCCLCVSWESTLYKTWWPQYTIPTFKILSSSSLQEVRVGEEISIVRVKVPWPLSEREALLHNFELEYFDEDLVIVLLNTIPEAENIDVSTHGFTKDGIPESNGTVRIDVVGGFVLQKVTPNRSYFRAIANMDIKVDFVPPWLINFISRQLIGNGHKLYTKAVSAVAAGDKNYRDALQKSMYTRIRQRLYSEEPQTTRLEDTTVEMIPDDIVTAGVLENEIEEDPKENDSPSKDFHQESYHEDLSIKKACSKEGGASISPEVEHALQLLDEAIAMLHNIRTLDGEGKPFNIRNKEEVSDRVKEEFCSSDEPSLGRCDFGQIVDGAENTPITNHHRGDEQATSMQDNDVEQRMRPEKQPPKHAPSILSNSGGKMMGTSLHNESGNLLKNQMLERMSKVHDEMTIEDGGTHHTNRSDGKSRGRKGHKRKKQLRFCGLLGRQMRDDK